MFQNKLITAVISSFLFVPFVLNHPVLPGGTAIFVNLLRNLVEATSFQIPYLFKSFMLVTCIYMCLYFQIVQVKIYLVLMV